MAFFCVNDHRLSADVTCYGDTMASIDAAVAVQLDPMKLKSRSPTFIPSPPLFHPLNGVRWNRMPFCSRWAKRKKNRRPNRCRVLPGVFTGFSRVSLGLFFLRITWSCLESAVVASLTAVALVVPEFDQLGRAKNKWSPFSLRRNDIQLKQDDGKKRERKNYRSTRKWSRLSFFFCSSCSRAQFPDRFPKSKTKQ